MNKKNTIFIVFLFVISTFAMNAQTGHATLDNLQEGDTLYYKVNSFNLPLTQLIVNGTGGIDWSKVQFDLSGSTIGLKVMKTSPSTGAYLLNSFVILGKSIVIPFPDGTPTKVTDIFGPTFTIPSGTGYAIGTTIPGSNWVSFVQSQSGSLPGIPVYIEPSNTANYKTYLDSKAASITNGTLTTTDGTDTFTVSYHEQNTNMSLTITLNWFKTGSNAGLFNSFSLTGTTLNANNQNVNIAFGFAFDHKQNNPLPTEIVSKQQQTLGIDSIGIDLSWSGDFFNQFFQNNGYNQTAYDQTRSKILSYKGNDAVRYLIDDVQGMYYQSEMDTYNFGGTGWNSNSPIWYDGFTGMPVTDNYNSNCATTPGCSTGNSVGIFFPLLAPAITPDWTVWQANMNSVNALINIITSTVTSSSVSNQILKYGLTINTFTNQAQLRQSGNIKYFYDQLDAKASYDASKADSSNIPSGFNGQEKASLDATGNIWSAYSNTGLIAGYGVGVNATLSVSNFPLNSTYRGDGSITFGIILKLKNDNLQSLPDGQAASPVGTGGLIPGVSPGFEAVPVFLVLVIVPIIAKRKRKMN